MATVSSRVRGICTVLLIAGAAIATNIWLLGTAWLALALIAVYARVGALHARLSLGFILPLAAGSLLITGMLQPAQAGDLWWSRFLAAASLSAPIWIRLALIAAAAQICILPLLGDGRIITFLRAWRCPERALLVMLGGITLLAEVRVRTRQVLEARAIQGYGISTRWGAVRQLPFLITPLTIYMLEAATSRADLWSRRDLVERLRLYRPVDDKVPSTALGVIAGVAALSWFAAAVWSRWMF